MRAVSGKQSVPAGIVESLGQAVVNRVRRVQGDAGMVMLSVVPVEKGPAENAGILNRAESVREIGPVLHRSELGLREWIVVGDVRSRVSLGHAEIGE